jgi:competence protein ComEA
MQKIKGEHTMKRLIFCLIAASFSLHLATGITTAAEKAQTNPGSPTECRVGSSMTAGLLDINGATEDQIKTLPGIDEAYCKKIIKGRPYSNLDQLVSNKIIPQDIFDKIRDLIVIIPPRK